MSRNSKGQWEEGTSGNKNGRPKGPTITEALKLRLGEGDTLNKIVDNIITKLVESGDIRTLTMLINRLDGSNKVSPSKLRQIFALIVEVLSNNIKDDELFDSIVEQLKEVFKEELTDL